MPGLPSRTRAALAWPAAAAAFALWHLPLALAPGWFSHDELQWQARAAVDSLAALPFSDWGALDRFQWRPLTFDLWLLLAWLGGGSPARMHALWLALGFALCALLYGTLRRAGVPARRAAAGAAAFATSPAAAYVHGWTATLAELLWVGLALALAWVLFGAPAAARRTPALAAGAAVGLALLCKEAALALPALLALAAWLRPEAARWRAALLGSLVPAALYLAARGALLLHAPRPEGAYAWSLAALPARPEEASA